MRAGWEDSSFEIDVELAFVVAADAGVGVGVVVMLRLGVFFVCAATLSAGTLRVGMDPGVVVGFTDRFGGLLAHLVAGDDGVGLLLTLPFEGPCGLLLCRAGLNEGTNDIRRDRRHLSKTQWSLHCLVAAGVLAARKTACGTQAATMHCAVFHGVGLVGLPADR